jgi:hypothetical protein
MGKLKSILISLLEILANNSNSAFLLNLCICLFCNGHLLSYIVYEKNMKDLAIIFDLCIVSISLENLSFENLMDFFFDESLQTRLSVFNFVITFL